MKLWIPVIAVAIFSISIISSVDAQGNYSIPSWVKGIAGFWAEDKISDQEFGEGLAFLIDQGIIDVPKISELENRVAELENENAQLKSQLGGSLPTPTYPTPSVEGDVFVSIPPGSGVPGCEEFDSCYIPSIVFVSVGDTVVWSNDDNAAHTVTSGTAADGPDGAFDSSMIMSGEEFSVKFNFEGEYLYFCMLHPWQVGEVIASSSLYPSEDYYQESTGETEFHLDDYDLESLCDSDYPYLWSDGYCYTIPEPNCPADHPYPWSDGFCYKSPEYLDNGCHSNFPYLWSDGYCRTVPESTYDEQVDSAPSCDPSYPDVCIPPYPPDLDCDEIFYSNFRVIGSDPHGLDADNDGIGCEVGSPSTTQPSCDPSYPDVCIPPYPPDLNCGDIGYSNFRVVGNDPHGFDGDNDGIGCES